MATKAREIKKRNCQNGCSNYKPFSDCDPQFELFLGVAAGMVFTMIILVIFGG